VSALQTALPVQPTYARQDVTLVEGAGCWVFGPRGERYLDLLAGIAVVGLGHRHPAPHAAAAVQLDRLWHVSNLYWTEPMLELAGRLSARFGGAQAFFCNSGTEAVEAALKWARRASGKPGIVALENSFHGRTMGALSATGQPAKQAPFAPLLPGVSFARANDVESLRAAVGPDTGCLLLEPVQGEGGVHPLTPEFLAAARMLADELGAFLVLDEVQTGVGRTGTFFAWEHLGTRPDAVALAKGLANGLPIGALLVADGLPGFEPGDHGSTFGGNAVVCAAARAVCDAVDDDLLQNVAARSAQLVRGLRRLDAVLEVRGRGLLIGAELDRPAAAVVDAAQERGVLVGTAGERTLRLTPPLVLSQEEAAIGLQTIEEVLS
jgi:predicted acetylornithine/succinylornithine family transaminase